jgi:endonuclease-8
MPEGDSLHRAARSLQVLVGERVEADSLHPRAVVTGVAARVDGRRLEAVEARGKNLLLRFEGGLVVRSHLRMSGRWQVRERGVRGEGVGDQRKRSLASDWSENPAGEGSALPEGIGRPWLVLRGPRHEAVLWNGPVLELARARPLRLGPDILAIPPDLDAMVARLRAENPGRAVGDALLDQRLVAGIGNVWKAEALWAAHVSPWRPLRETSDEELRAVLGSAAELMRASVDGRRPERRVYRHAGRPCPRCGEPIRSRGQGDTNRTAYWCPRCQQ